MIGKTISHYKILEKLGEGGMGVVYKAQDTKLDRFVALKFLPPHALGSEEEKTRFIHEAQAAAGLSHPNICTIHEIDDSHGQTFIAMEYIKGESLKEKIARGPLELKEVIQIGIQAAEGLYEAHRKKMIHRDIKSANIMITENNRVKIMDFGLAKLSGRTKITKTGTTVGTISYMSPEQVKGEKVDHRSDIWSLGIVLYEMLTGQLPFRGEYEQAVTYSILNEEPEPVTALRTGIPMELERVINKCLAKEPSKRHQYVEDVLVDLNEIKEKHDLKKKTMTQQVPSQKRYIPKITAIAIVFVLVILTGIYFLTRQADVIDSIAVLPLNNMMGESHEYFVAGMHEALITELSKISALKVISRTSTMGYVETNKKIPEIARELDVDAVLEGSIYQEEENIRITTQLIRGRTDEHIWQGSFDRKLMNILALHTDVARAVANQIQIALKPEEEARLEAVPPEVNPEAYDHYLQGWRYRWEETDTSLQKAIEHLEQAVVLDPDFVSWPGLTYVLFMV